MDKHQLSKFVFENYGIDYIQYSVNEDFNNREEVELDLEIEVSVKVKDDELKSAITLIAHVFDDAKNKNYPFSLDVSITGFFSAEGDMKPDEFKEYCKCNGTAVLFPFLRSTIADVTRTANVQPLILPLFNIHNLIKQQEKTNKESNNK